MYVCIPLLLNKSIINFVQETERRVRETQDRERSNLNKVILEERKWYCGFISAFSKSLVSTVQWTQLPNLSHF